MQNKLYVIPGLIITILVLLLPFWYNNTAGLEDNRPVLEKAQIPIDPETGKNVTGPCDRFVEAGAKGLDIWHRRHPEFVSFYLDYDPKVAQCDNCHRNPDEFCNKCHKYAGVKLSQAPRDDTSVLQTFIPLFRSGNVTEKVHHHRWMKDILKTEDIKERRCFACHRDTHCKKCHPIRDPLRELAE